MNAMGKIIPEILEYTEGILNDAEAHAFSKPSKAARFLWKNRNLFVWSIMSNFEGMSITLPETEVILNGSTVGDLSIQDVLKVRAYGRALESLCMDVRDGIFVPDRYSLIELHRIAAKYEIDDDELGCFRRENVAFRNVRWRPPSYLDLKYYWPQVERHVSSKKDMEEHALVMFLALSRIQFFPDVNKRTAMLFCNGYLMNGGKTPFLIPQEEKVRFTTLLHDFYESGKADAMLKFLAETSLVKPEKEQGEQREGMDGEKFQL